MRDKVPESLSSPLEEAASQENPRLKRSPFIAVLGLIIICLTSCSGKTPSDLKIDDIVAGEGGQAVRGSIVTVHYTGWLYKNGRRGKKFDSSLHDGQPFSFKLGAGDVIPGWDRGIEGMRVGGKRELIVPPDLGYGKQGAPPLIPPDSTLDFEVQLLEVQH
jgi:peptidylprolyl isomerase